MVIRRALRLALTGILIGIASALLLTGFLDTLLYDVSSSDPTTFVAVPLILLVVALASTWIPARRALRMDPREALVTD
jgi:ABC-type antimicrobial peptide transport system permease subunit